MTKLTRMFIDAASENVDALPRRLADLGVRYPKEREEEFLGGTARALLPLLRREPRGDRSDAGHPRGVPADLLDEPSPAYALPAARQARSRRSARSASTSIRTSTSSRSRGPTRAACCCDRFAPRRMAARARKETLRLGQMALELPYQLHDILEEVRDGQIEVGFVHKGLDDLLNRLDVVFNRLVIAMIVAGGLIGSSLIGIFAKAGPQLLGINIISVLGFAFSGLLGMWLLWGVVRSGRLVDRSSQFRAERTSSPARTAALRSIACPPHLLLELEPERLSRAAPAQRRLRRRRRRDAAGSRPPCRQRRRGGVPSPAGRTCR